MNHGADVDESVSQSAQSSRTDYSVKHAKWADIIKHDDSDNLHKARSKSSREHISKQLYNDSNLDWSFTVLTPSMIKILQDDRATFMRRRSRDSARRSLGGTIKRLSSAGRLKSLLSNIDEEEINEALEKINLWSFNIFDTAERTGYHVMKPMAMRIFDNHNLLRKYKIPELLFAEFVEKIHRHYRHNPYHNAIHASDVMQTVNCLMIQTGFINMMNDLEIFCILLTSLLHDIEHTGVNNNFHRNARSEMAKLYVVSILENHHVRVSLGLLRIFDILDHFSLAEQEEFKEMLCGMILSTDMASHFLLITNMKLILHAPVRCSSRIRIRRIMLLLLHAADISNAAKPWNVHKIWVSLICQEFFDQGEKEKSLKLPVSPYCDKHTVNIAALQLGFMETFCRETFEVLFHLMEKDTTEAGRTFTPFFAWSQCLNLNAERWTTNSSSLKLEFINELLLETATPRKSIVGDPRRRSQKRGRESKWSKWCCACLCQRHHDRQLFKLNSELVSTTTS